MRPIKLKIKGLNSFIEEQTIDFEKLTDRGLFGIFGPTGSGKSTILDGITLALYGDVSRKSSNYINTNCDRLNVSFEFQISGAEIKRYLVTREFKRDKKSGNPISGKCKIVDITNGEEVLADKVKAVTDKCKEVIGLSLEDFTRTVVLPQGKFSEFLKLEGKPRREMLERLFNLEQYGDNLSRKLSREINHEKTENSVLLGQLMGYEDISEEKKAEKEEELKLSIDNLNKVAKELKDIDKSFKENQELWDMQLEVRGYKEKENALKERAIEIESFKEKVKLGEAANKVKPYISTYENTLNNINFTERELRELKIKCEELNSNKKIIEEQWNNARLIRDSKLSQYKVQEEKIKDAINDKKSLDLLENEIKEINNNVNELNKKKKENEEKLVDSEERLKRGNDLLKEKEEYRDTLNIDSEFKKYVQDGLVLTRDYNNYLKLLKDIETKINTINELVKKSLEEKNILKVEFDKKNYLLKENENNLESLIKNCPGNQNDLFDMQEKYSELKGQLDIYNRSNEEIKKNIKLIEELSIELKPKKEEFNKLDNEIKRIKVDVLEIERENLAHKLREELMYGDVCPVCGSTEHHKENIKHVEIKDITSLEESIELKEKILDTLSNNIKDMEAKLEISKNKLDEEKEVIKALGEDFNEEIVKSIQLKINDLRVKINEYNTKKEELEKIIKVLKDECNNSKLKFTELETKIGSYENQVKTLEDERKNQYNKLKEAEDSLNILKEKTSVQDFISKNEEINKVEKEREEIEKTIKKYRDRIEVLNADKENATKNLAETNEELAKISTVLKEKNKVREENLNKLKSKVDDINNIEESLINIQKEIKEIEDNYVIAEKQKEEANKIYEECNSKLISITSKIKELYNRKEEEKEKLEIILKEEEFLNIDEVKINLLDKEKIKELKSEIDKYKENLSQLKGAIESITKKIGDRKLLEEEWILIQKEKEEKELKVKELNEIKIKVEEELKIIKEKILELKDLLKQKEKLDHKLALLNDLDKLFKGKKFVEFVAATRLKYVSLEASKKLKEITNGNYGLEVDEDGRFIIRDYKNGGAERDASTLSGGETFLASLALALALSAEIQLKGTAPLELFFLDEGFGTLDDNLLEVVMSSLERIHNDKLKVGIISHVESIKNRVPVKLLITPAEAGLGGSKVKIERS
ncbi:AAA family ATPase [Clostridium sp. K12(2020)]|uniref:AAA family ATPase n=1 Tax=unclassified Clostridium TaxID=2614128 RepID=UPI001C8BD037|nr:MULTISPECIES: AAA family ATPase [unclassified Clostridium]MBX9136921.1 AAA family ATPase [Clostridium sp. K12(2020)]MBX9143761.1 AAA family ATPase [Clostridium sp. K13]